MNGVDIATLRALIEVDTSRALRNLNGFKSSYSDVNNTIRNSKTSWEQAQAAIDHFGDALSHVRNLAQNSFAAMKDGARSISLRESLSEDIRAVGGDFDTYLAKLDEAAGGTISNYNLMLSASKSMSLGLSSNIDQIAGLLEIAKAQAMRMGTDTTDAFNDIVTGLARGSPLILDNLGIMIDLEGAYQRYADSIGIAASELTEAQKREALLQDTLATGQTVLRDSRSHIGELADSYRILESRINNARDAWGEIAAVAGAGLIGQGGALEGIFNPEAAANALKQLQAIVIARDALIAQNPEMSAADQWAFTSAANIGNMEQARAVLERYPGAWDEYRLAVAAATDQTGLTTGRLQEVLISLGLVNGETQSLTNVQLQASVTNELFADTLNFVARAMGVAAENIPILRAEAAYLSNSFYGVTLSALEAAAAIRETFGAAIGRLDSARNKAGSPIWEGFESDNGTGGGVKNIMGGHVSAYQAAQVTMGSIAGAGRAGVNAVEREAQQVERIWNDLVGEVRGGLNSVLNFSTSVGTHDALLDTFGLRRQMESTETARQLADIRDRALEGQRSPWLAMFPEADAADIQEIAARAEALLRDLSSGRRFDLLDRNVVKANLIDAISQQRAAEAWKDALVQEVAAEMGMGEQQVDKAISEMLGIATTGAGEASGGDIIASMTSGMKAAAEARVSELEVVGETFGKAIGDGTLRAFGADRVIAELINQMTEALAA